MNESKYYRNTIIFYRTKNGAPMTCFIVDEYGNCSSATRAVCLTRQDASDGQPTQRRSVYREYGTVVRLPRTEESEILVRDNMRSIWRVAKQHKRNYEYIYKGSDNCSSRIIVEDGSRKCDVCERSNARHAVRMDMKVISTVICGLLPILLEILLTLLPEITPVAVDAVKTIVDALIENLPLLIDVAVRLVTFLPVYKFLQ